MTTLAALEWDTYTVTQDPNVTGYDVVESCAPQPVAVNPAANQDMYFVLAPETMHSLLVSFKTATGTLLHGVTADISRAGYSTTTVSSGCGQVFVGSLGQHTYTIDASKSGYYAASTTVDVSGATVTSLTMTPL